MGRHLHSSSFKIHWLSFHLKDHKKSSSTAACAQPSCLPACTAKTLFLFLELAYLSCARMLVERRTVCALPRHRHTSFFFVFFWSNHMARRIREGWFVFPCPEKLNLFRRHCFDAPDEQPTIQFFSKYQMNVSRIRLCADNRKQRVKQVKYSPPELHFFDRALAEFAPQLGCYGADFKKVLFFFFPLSANQMWAPSFPKHSNVLHLYAAESLPSLICGPVYIVSHAMCMTELNNQLPE